MPSAMQKPLVFEATAHGVCLLLSQPFTKFTASSRNVAMLASLSDPDSHELIWNPFPQTELIFSAMFLIPRPSRSVR